MTKQKQTHIFASRLDMELPLRLLESGISLKYARYGMYEKPQCEEYRSLLELRDLGVTTASDHMSGPQFLIVGQNTEFILERVLQQAATPKVGISQPYVIAADNIDGRVMPLDEALSSIENRDRTSRGIPTAETRYSLTQKMNPDSVVFIPGGIYRQERVMICGHIGTASMASGSLSLYKTFVRTLTKGFERIGSYLVGADAKRLMNAGYRMVTISIGSPAAYDLRSD